MKLVVIYGSPAMGKLSVAKALSEMTGYRLFHNHASLDFVGTLFEFGTPKFNALVMKYRKEMLEEAAKSGIDAIFTSAWVKGYSPKIIKELKSIIERHGGEVCFVYLYADKKEQLRRAESKSRKCYGKIKSRKQLAEFIKRHGFSRRAPISGSLAIDNTHISPRKAAKMIAEHYSIPIRKNSSGHNFIKCRRPKES
jgi:hypothetical protein